MSGLISQGSLAAEGGTQRLILKPLAMVLGLVVLGVVLKMGISQLDMGSLQDYVLQQGAWGTLTFILGGAVLTAIGLPRQAIAFAGGYVFGWKLGLALSMLAVTTGCVMDFYLASTVVRGWIRHRIGNRMVWVHRKLCARPVAASLTLRLLPIGNNTVLNLLAGLSSVKARPFLIASILGYLPQTLILGLLGSGVQVSHETQLIVAALLFVASTILGITLLKRGQPRTV
jgi:uncharacterized membrane protein YdjX (TVP38/TMEM64 family)